MGSEIEWVGNYTTPDPGAEWEVWYQDTFDSECPRHVEATGHGLVEGLAELWSRHLLGTVRPNGQPGFSRFNLWWKRENRSIEIVGEWEGLVRLRKWVYGGKQRTGEKSGEQANIELLKKIAKVHQHLILRGDTSIEIVAAARDCENRQDFEQRLPGLLSAGSRPAS
jgi:heme-degrading monooxygenase HmoA